MVLAFHIGTDPVDLSAQTVGINFRGPGGAILNYVETTYSGQRAVTKLVASGALDRHPNLKMLVSEGGATWVPFLADRMTEAYRQHHMMVRPKLSRTPREILYSQVYASFQHDETAVSAMTANGYRNVMWGSDYPHMEGTYGHTQETLHGLFDGVPDESATASRSGRSSTCSRASALLPRCDPEFRRSTTPDQQHRSSGRSRGSRRPLAGGRRARSSLHHRLARRGDRRLRSRARAFALGRARARRRVVGAGDGDRHLPPSDRRDAALANGIAAHSLELDDVAQLMGGHPAVSVCSSALTLAETLDAKASDTVAAIVAGYDAACRIAVALGPGHAAAGWHATGTIGTFAAAAACARLLGLDPTEIESALGLAASSAAGLGAASGPLRNRRTRPRRRRRHAGGAARCRRRHRTTTRHRTLRGRGRVHAGRRSSG